MDPVESIAETDTVPTPPPRKKKLKKKLEQIVEKQLDQNLMVKSSEADNVEGEQQQKLNVEIAVESSESGVGVEEALQVGQTNSEEVTGQEGKSPKKSRRKKKHNTVQG